MIRDYLTGATILHDSSSATCGSCEALPAVSKGIVGGSLQMPWKAPVQLRGKASSHFPGLGCEAPSESCDSFGFPFFLGGLQTQGFILESLVGPRGKRENQRRGGMSQIRPLWISLCLFACACMHQKIGVYLRWVLPGICFRGTLPRAKISRWPSLRRTRSRHFSGEVDVGVTFLAAIG